MKKLLILASLIFVIFAFKTNAQEKKSVSAEEVNGTFRAYFGGEFKDNYNEIKILALGGGKLRVAFNLTYPFVIGTNAMSANTGEANGTATIERDAAIFKPDKTEQCEITIKFVKSGTIEITQSSANSDCGFGLNVSASGTYKKSSGAKPDF